MVQNNNRCSKRNLWKKRKYIIKSHWWSHSLNIIKNQIKSAKYKFRKNQSDESYKYWKSLHLKFKNKIIQAKCNLTKNFIDQFNKNNTKPFFQATTNSITTQCHS